MENSEKLKQLILERPDLEIVPFCAEECGGDNGYMMAEVGKCSIEFMALEAPWDDERVMIKSESFDDYHDWRWDNDENIVNLDDDTVEQCIRDDYEKFDWVERIVLWIESV